jgi:hypothetical protein
MEAGFRTALLSTVEVRDGLAPELPRGDGEMKKAMRAVVAAMGFVLMGMASVTVAGDMMESKEPMMEHKMTDHKGMEETPMKEPMAGSEMEGKSMMPEGKADSMEEEMDKGAGMAGEMKETK